MCPVWRTIGGRIPKLKSLQTIFASSTFCPANMTLRQYKAEVNRVCAQVVKVSQRKRLQVLREELASFPASYREPALQLIATTVELTGDNMTMQKWEKITMIAAGAATVAVLLSIAVLLPQPT